MGFCLALFGLVLVLGWVSPSFESSHLERIGASTEDMGSLRGYKGSSGVRSSGSPKADGLGIQGVLGFGLPKLLTTLLHICHMCACARMLDPKSLKNP